MPRPESEPHPEHEPRSYQRASRFDGEESAGVAYFATENLIRHPECDLSAYRLQLNQVWLVAVIGEQPSAELAAQIEAALAMGEPVSLPEPIVSFLRKRREQQKQPGGWVERHY